MVGAYLPAARRSYDLSDIAAQRGLAAGAEPEKAEGDGQLELGGAAAGPGGRGSPGLGACGAAAQVDEEAGIERLMDEVEMPLIEVLAHMEQTGVLLDRKRLADIGEGFEQRIETLQAEIFELAGHEFTIGPRSSSPRSSSTSSG